MYNAVKDYTKNTSNNSFITKQHASLNYFLDLLQPLIERCYVKAKNARLFSANIAYAYNESSYEYDHVTSWCSQNTAEKHVRKIECCVIC